MKNECSFVRDVLPLYFENMVSEDTAEFVKEHLENCPACAAELESMKVLKTLEITADTQANDEKMLMAFAEKWNRKKRVVISAFVAVVVIAVLFGSCFLSYIKFDTINPISAANGFIQVTVVGKDYLEIQESPRVIIAQPNEELFIKYMESRGFTEVERFDSFRYFADDEGMESVCYSQNAYFAKWTWEH